MKQNKILAVFSVFLSVAMLASAVNARGLQADIIDQPFIGC